MSPRAFRNCIKNPGHPGFIPAPEFSLSHLPEELRRDVVLRYIKNYAARTVRVRTQCISQERPDGYPFCQYRGSTLPRVGSGWVCGVSSLDGPCRCHICSREGVQPKEICWEVTLVTACHVVFNTEEARQTRVDLFYDDEASIEDGNVISLWGSEVEQTDISADRSALNCVTHDVMIVQLLEQYRREAVFLWNTILRDLPYIEESVCFAISHPHGRSKRITVGAQVGKTQGFLPSYFYTADTCPGSPGGPVVVIPGRDYGDPGWWPIVLHHSGTQPERAKDCGVNFSGSRSSMYV